MKPEPGEIVLVPFPFSDLSSAKLRPTLVLSSTDYNRHSQDVIVCGITSNLSNADRSVLVTSRDLSRGRLVADSRIKVDKIASLDQGMIRKSVGHLRPAVLDRVMIEFFALFKRRVPR